MVEFGCRVDVGGTEKWWSLGVGLALELRGSSGV